MKTAIKVSASLFCILTPLLLWAVYFNNDRIAWISALQYSLYIESNADQVTYEFHPLIHITATNIKILMTIDNFFDKSEWKNITTIGESNIQISFNNGGFDYGGIAVSPALNISYPYTNSPTINESYYETIFDIREFCGDTLKNNICKSNNPFKGLTPLFWTLHIYSFVCMVLLTLFVLIPNHKNRKLSKADLSFKISS